MDIHEEMRRHAKTAAEMVQAEYGYELDFSDGTVGAVEAILDNLSQEEKPADELYSTSSLLFGSYLGEVIRTRYPDAVWELPQQTTGQALPSIQVAGRDVSPLMWCYERLTNGAADSVAEKYITLCESIGTGK